MPKSLTVAAMTALEKFNNDYNQSWDFGTNWTNVGTQFETFVNKYLFPKISETTLVNIDLGNRFDWLAKEVDFVSQYSEEYVILDSVPVAMNLSKSEELMLKRNYPKMATRLYGTGILKKQKFTLNNNDVRLNFLTLADGVKYAMAVYKKKISDINVQEEKEIKAMVTDYALNHTNNVRHVVSREELFNAVFEALLNIQNNSDKYNETRDASGGAIGRYTTTTKLDDVVILTNDSMKTFLLDTKIANTFQIKGLDVSDRIISFDDLGGVFKTTEDITINAPETLAFLQSYGDYQVAIGDVVPEGSTITFDVSELTEFVGKVVEIKPESELFAYIFDVNKLKYRRNTKDMLKKPFHNGEFDEVTYWIHYYSFKSMSPFFNNVLVTQKPEEEEEEGEGVEG